jgi:predicted O-methyltransferase YrrM
LQSPRLFLRLMVASRGVKRALEIGGASGYSAIWIGEGLRLTGGRLVTLEYDAARAKELSDNIRRAGLSDIVAVIAGDGFQQIPNCRERSISYFSMPGSRTTNDSSISSIRAWIGMDYF